MNAVESIPVIEEKATSDFNLIITIGEMEEKVSKHMSDEDKELILEITSGLKELVMGRLMISSLLHEMLTKHPHILD